MKRETYPKARERLFAEFRALGFEVKDKLKVPQVKFIVGVETRTLYFKTQAVYLEDLSLHTDIRSMSADTLIALATTRNSSK